MKKILQYGILTTLLVLGMVGCGTAPVTDPATELTLEASTATKSSTGIVSWSLTRLANGTGIQGLAANGKTVTSLECLTGGGGLSLTQRFYDASGQVSTTRQLTAGVEQVNPPAYTSQQARTMSSLSFDLNQSIDPSGGLIEIPGPIKPIKTPCEKATNQLNRALANYNQANAVIEACRARFGFAPGVCQAELAAFEQAYATLVQASDNYNATCLGPNPTLSGVATTASLKWPMSKN